MPASTLDRAHRKPFDKDRAGGAQRAAADECLAAREGAFDADELLDFRPLFARHRVAQAAHQEAPGSRIELQFVGPCHSRPPERARTAIPSRPTGAK
jgi:hypothetical protein